MGLPHATMGAKMEKNICARSVAAGKHTNRLELWTYITK